PNRTTPAPNPQPNPTIPSTKPPTTGIPAPSKTQTDPNTDPSWIYLSIQSNKDETVQLSDDGKAFQNAVIKAGQPFVFKFEIYKYGWLRIKYDNGYRTYKLAHGTDCSILWNRRTNNWSVVAIAD